MGAILLGLTIIVGMATVSEIVRGLTGRDALDFRKGKTKKQSYKYESANRK